MECLSCNKEAAIAVYPTRFTVYGAEPWEEEYCLTHFALWGGNGEFDLSTARLIVEITL